MCDAKISPNVFRKMSPVSIAVEKKRYTTYWEDIELHVSVRQK